MNLSLLEEFVFALSSTERQKLRPLQFRGAKRVIFFKVLACETRTGIDKAAITKTQKLTEQRYYQLLSEILDACYTDVAPAGGVELLRYLGNKQLYRHLVREMQKEERFLIAKKNTRKLEHYYFTMLVYSEFFMIPPNLGGGFIGVLREYMTKYLEVKQPHPHDELLRRAVAINTVIEEELLVKYDSKRMEGYLAEFEEIYAELKLGDHVLAKFKTLFFLITYYAKLIPILTKLETFVEEGKALMQRHPKEFDQISELFHLNCELEVCRLKMTDYDLSYYKTFFHEKQLWKSGFSLQYMYKFFPFILEARDLKLARTYIRKYFPANIELVRNEIAIYYWTLLLLYDLYQEHYAEAERHFQRALSVNVGATKNINFEIYLRRFDVFFSAMRRGPMNAEITIQRNVRHAADHGFAKSSYMKTMEGLVKYVDIDREKATELLNTFLGSRQDNKFLYLLVQKVYDKYY